MKLKRAGTEKDFSSAQLEAIVAESKRLRDEFLEGEAAEASRKAKKGRTT